jgi:hypothetical protein
MAVPVVGSGLCGPNAYRDKFRLPTGAEGLKDDNLGKRTIGRPRTKGCLELQEMVAWPAELEAIARLPGSNCKRA